MVILRVIRLTMQQSTAIAQKLPSIAELRRLTRSMAMLDAVLSPEWDYRYYSYNVSWGPGEEMASMRDGSGDEWFLLFDTHGAALKGFAHELPNAYAETFPTLIRRSVPADFASFLDEPAFAQMQATFCIWRRTTDAWWTAVPADPGMWPNGVDGSDELLALFDGRPQSYQEWAEDYYEHEVDLEVVKAIYAHQPLTQHLVHQLNPDLSLAEAVHFAQEIGYPV